MINRRLFLRAGAVALAAPAIVRASSIMKIWTPPALALQLSFWDRNIWVDMASGLDCTVGGYVEFDPVKNHVIRWTPYEMSLIAANLAQIAHQSQERPGEKRFEYVATDRLRLHPVPQSQVGEVVECARNDPAIRRVFSKGIL